MLTTACQACAKVLRYEEKDSGHRIHCPQCGHPQVLGLVDANTDAVLTQGPEKAAANRRPASYPTAMPALPALDTGGDRSPFRLPTRSDTSFLAPPQSA